MSDRKRQGGEEEMGREEFRERTGDEGGRRRPYVESESSLAH